MQQKTKKGQYKDTLNLPRTSFSMKADLPNREPAFIKKWQEMDIYSEILKKRKPSGKHFILHDGPPYANGHIHLGHVLNKTLKDICVKYFSMKGFYSPYVPGWDCHGLPVEHQLLKELNMKKHEIDQVEFRKKAYKYAMKFVGIQRKEFERLGVFGDWGNPYLTLTKEYEADILCALADLYGKGYIYKDLKPVNWCANCETALAEAEVEYEQKKSPSIIVKFESVNKADGKSTFFIVWTTTPWTLLANVAVAVHPDFKYSFVLVGEEIWILAEDLVSSVMEKSGVDSYEIIRHVHGRQLVEELPKAKHPFLNRDSVLVLADYVTKEEGTGCVHTAPGHGQDDYLTGKKYDLPVIMPVDADGKFKPGVEEFEGVHITKANGLIIDKMKSNDTLISAKIIEHSYPHCWRCKEPIIFRATEQWFMNVDHNNLRNDILREIKEKIKWVPASGSERISAMVEGRPDWCLSRQRYWGVPIPAFKCEGCGETFTNEAIIKNVAELTLKEGSNVWFEREPDELLPAGFSCPECSGKKFKKEGDILDVWFDSGVSHKAVLERREDLSFPGDLYLEGSDQHRGWFQSALITSMGMNGCPPYKEVLTHGFVVDGEGKKMSKSLGNVVSPEEVMKKYGADILRLWVASSDYEGDIKLSSEILERLADGYRKIRNTFKFLLSNLYDFEFPKDAVDLEGMAEIDRWMLSRLRGVIREVTEFYDRWEFYKVYRAVYNFCVFEVSAFFLDVSKDVLYVMSQDSPERRSAQTVIYRILTSLVRLMAPILSFTSEEAYQALNDKNKEQSVHLEDWPDTDKEMAGWENKALDDKWEKILNMRDGVLKLLELKRESGMIGSSLEAAIVLSSEDEQEKTFLKNNIELLPGLLKVSQAEVEDEVAGDFDELPGGPIFIKITKAKGEKCQRCWNYSGTVGTHKDHSDLCSRCYDVIFERSNNEKNGQNS